MFHYENGILRFFATAEGYVNVSAGRYNYVYNYTDHLGNVRLSYVNDRLLGVRVIEENNYYPFGLKHNGYNNISPPNSVYKYKFNGMELQDELGLNVYDFGARNYMPDLGRWANIDPFAEQSRRWTPYNYAYNNPVYFIDPDGMQAMSTGYGSVDFETSNIAIEFTSFGGLGKSNGGKEENKNNLSAANTGAEPISNSGSTSPVDAEYTLPVVSLELVSDTKAFENFVYANSPYYAHMFMSSGASGSGWLSDVQYGLGIVGSSEIPIASQVGDVLSAIISFYEGDYTGGLLSIGGTVVPGLSQAKLGARVVKIAGKFSKAPPGNLTKLKKGQGWKDSQGNIWKKDMKHKDHWDVTDPKTGKKVKEVDFEGNQIWPDGPKNKNKK